MGLIDSIKKEAKGNHTIIQSSEAAQLEKILNKLFYLPKNIEAETAFIKQVMTRGADSQERIGLHASALIKGEKDFCIREQVLALMYKQLQGEQLSVDLLRIFEEGNAIHEKWQRLFIRAGYSEPHELDLTRTNKKYRINYTPDIICRIPEFYEEDMVGELKSVNTFQFKKMVENNKPHPSAGKQLQWYMYLTGLKKGFVLSEDKNTQAFKIEVYDFDFNIVAPFIERAEQIKYHYKEFNKNGKMVSRPSDANSPACKRCSKCAMRDACWNIGMGRVKL